ncbi:hypothetical protein MID13_01090 [Vibrio gigantis]|uniref:hypothetical protein n=1 Tax=Vibrio gigantis TaxID=296199 RepID=UPI001EFAF643|nr:hypothetical protein [Vibrio gigantis]ULN64470.1 hypothetical protein MID13_01090 [Vibrio gigantis]
MSDAVGFDGVSSFNFHLLLLISIPTYFFIGMAISITLSRNVNLILFDYFVLFCIVVLVSLNTNFQYMRLAFESFTVDKAVYLFLGDILVLVAIYYMSALFMYRKYKFIFFIFVVLLFIVYSRTSLYFFVSSVIACEFILINKKKKLLLLFLFLCCSYLIYSYQDSLLNMNFSYSINRMLFVFLGGSDGSLSGRELIFIESTSSLFDSWFLGDFSDQINIFGSWSFYIHNIVSYLRQFGILTFISVVYILIQSLLYFIPHVVNPERKLIERKYIFGLLLTIFLILIYSFSRSYNYAYLFLLPGYIIGLKSNEKKENPPNR